MRHLWNLFGILILSTALCFARMQAIQETGGSLVGDSSPGSASNSHQLKSYKRIRIAKKEDLDEVFRIINIYIDAPELAESVEEIVVDTTALKRHSSCLISWPGISEREKPIYSSTHGDSVWEPIRTYIGGIGLSKASTNAMLRSLDLMKRHQATPPLCSDDCRTGFRIYPLTMATIIISFCKNIKSFYIGGQISNSPLEEFLRNANYGLLPRPVLQNLEMVEVMNGDHDFVDSIQYYPVEFMEHFQYFHRLPAIKSIVMNGLTEFQADRSFFVPRTGNMKKIEIRYSGISDEMLSTIISIPKELEEFRLSLGGLHTRDGGYYQVIPKPLSRSLLQHRNTLKVLDLDIDHVLRGDYYFVRGPDMRERDEEYAVSSWDLA